MRICPAQALIAAHLRVKVRRHIVVRKQISRRPQAAGMLLFEDVPDYRYSIYMTNLRLPAQQSWNIHNSRADCKNRMCKLKESFALAAFCMQAFWATEASLRFIIAAYILLSL